MKIFNILIIFLFRKYNSYILNNNKINNKIKEKNVVTLHLERFNIKYNLIHTGISFNNSKNVIRFDFRPYNFGKSYLTNEILRNDINLLFPDVLLKNNQIKNFYLYRNLLNENKDNLYKCDIFWGISNKSQNEILKFEQNNLISKKYYVGIYDCRHYVRDFSIWSLEQSIPIWKLDSLWK